MNTSRRKFLVGCSAAVAAMAGSRIGWVALGDPASSGEVLVILFLRGGMDGLSLVPPIDGNDRAHYEEARPALKVPLAGTGAALRLNAQFGLHPSAEALIPLFQGGKLAIVQAVGNAGSRSHFDAQRFIELGTPGIKGTATGWLTRHLQSAPSLAKTILMPALAAGATPPVSLLGSDETVNMSSAQDFSLSQFGHWSWVQSDQRIAMRRIYQQGDTFMHRAGLDVLNATGLIESYVTPNYKPSNGAVYPDGSLGYQLKMIAQMIKLDLGVRVATVDFGGWDTHENQSTYPGGYFSNLVSELSRGLAAFYTDLDGSAANSATKRLTVIVQSEFGRRIRENASRGTDHGTANPVFVLGGNVRGGLYGNWPGLDPEKRFDSADLAPTTDYRQLISEILIRRFGNPKLGFVFPKYQDYSPLNIVSGADVTPDYTIPVPASPANFTAVRSRPGVVLLSWKRPLHATNYRLERQVESAENWKPLITLAADQLSFEDLSAPAGTGLSYRLQAFSSYGESPFVTASPEAVQSPLKQWRMRYFGTTEDSGPAANSQVSSSDGMTNFTKYALGLDPTVPIQTFANGFTPGRPKPEPSNGRPTLLYVRPLDRADVQYEVLASADLKTWVTATEVSEGTADGMERRRATAPPTSANMQFFRLMVRAA